MRVPKIRLFLSNAAPSKAALSGVAALMLLTACAGDKAATSKPPPAGAWLGSGLGQSLNADDRRYLEGRTRDSLEYAQTDAVMDWANPKTGHRGTVRVHQTYKDATGRDCRAFEQTIEISGRRETAPGHACRTAGGTWVMADGSG